MKRFSIKIQLILVVSVLALSCKKLVTIDPPISTITTTETFRDSIHTESAFAGLYSSMANNGLAFMSGAITQLPGESADELTPFQSSGDLFYANTLTYQSGNDLLNAYIWGPAYQYIYQTNAIIGGVQASVGLSPIAKKRFIAEAKFLRALYYFYLINLYGNLPYVTSIDFHVTQNAASIPAEQIYPQIIADLNEAKAALPADYSAWGNDRSRATRWAASALLARVYLYTKQWALAEEESGNVINNNSLFSLNPDLNSVFLKNALGNNEAILQFSLNTTSGNATPEGLLFVPYPGGNPYYYLNSQLLSVFEPGDRRKVAWVDTITYNGDLYYFPYKYKIGQAQITYGGSSSEYIMVLRAAEQYLIRAEARAEENKLAEAIADLNIIRNRAGLGNLSPTLNQTQVIAACAQENRIELFAESGHRWFDLKRTGQIDAVMKVATPLKGQGTQWQSYQQLYPIPPYELQADQNLRQNPGY